LTVYDDDILLACKDNKTGNIRKLIKKKFRKKDVGNVNFIIRIKFTKHADGYFIDQTRYLQEILRKFKMTNATPSRNVTPIDNEELRKMKVDRTKYKSANGNLLYLSICTRPDIIYAVLKATPKSKDSYLEDWQNVLKILRTIGYGINFLRNSKVKAFLDADYAGDPKTRKSTTRFIINL